MYCYVSYRLDIVNGVTILSKFSSTTYGYHYICLNNLARYLRITRDWGIRYKRRGPRLDLPEPKCHSIVWDKNIHKPKQDIDKSDLIFPVDAAKGNELI